MQRDVRRALLVALLLAPALPAAWAGGAHLESSAREGEGALYRVVTTRAGAAETSEVFFEWRAQSALVPGGEGRTFPTLATYVVKPTLEPAAGARREAASGASINPGRDYAAHDPPTVRSRDAHVTHPGGDLLARSAKWFERDDEGARGQWVGRASRADACDLASPETLLAATWGLDARAADAKLSACGAAVAREGATLEVALDGATLTFDYVAALGFPIAWTREADGARVEATMIGWRAGEGGLPGAAPLGEPDRVPLVEWTAAGPARGDLADHPFREARRALVAQEPDAAAYFHENADARVLYATHAWTDIATVASSQSDAWRSRIRGNPCGVAPAAGPSTAGSWTAGWASPDGSLFAIVERLDAGGLVEIDRVAAVSRDSSAWRESGEPATRAPAPADLATRRHDLDPWWPRGGYSIDYAFVPTVHGNLVGAAAISRGACERDVATGRVAYQGLSLWFVDGVAHSVVGTTIEQDENAAVAGVLQSLTPPPSAPAPSQGRSGLTLVGGAAALAVGAAAAALVLPRALEMLYSRIHRGSALDSQRRAALLEAVVRAPGAPLRDLAAGLGIAVSTAEHHARVLRRLGYLRRVRTGQGVAYYPAEHPRAPVAHVLDRAHADALLAAALARPDATQQELAEALGMRETHLSELVRDLEREGLVERRRDGRRVRVRATAKAQALRPQ